jgi:3'-phosphoadenosine 5'-phosphosulfate sulfotransferase (PAPS reductase)/FAD synthetase
MLGGNHNTGGIMEKVLGKGYAVAWETTAKVIVSKNFGGLRVSCPKCNKIGTLISKWIKGPPIKPLYVCHGEGNGYFKACDLDREQAIAARSKIAINREDVLKTLRMGRPIVLFSGGKDSLCLLHYLSRLGKRIRKEVTALHVDTTASFPEVEEYVRNVCSELGVPLITVRPLHDYFDLAKRWGIPGVKSRWCCETLKIAPIRRFFADLEGQKIVFDGIRSAESNIRATYIPIWYHPSFRCISVSPIFGWSDEKVKKYIELNNLPISPTAHLNTSAECWCGAYKCRNDFEALLNIHPEMFDKLVEVEKAQKGKYTFLFEKGVRVPLDSLKEGKSKR